MSTVSKTARILPPKKSIAIEAPSGRKLFNFTVLKVRKWTVISPTKIIKILQNDYNERNCIVPV